MMTTKQKLLRLADFLEHKVKSHWFDLTSWSTRGFPEKECGTTACAAGWATACFPRSGLSLVHLRYRCDLELSYDRGDGLIILKGMIACMAFFQIDEKTAGHLFHPDEYPEKRRGRMSVVQRLRKTAELLK